MFKCLKPRLQIRGHLSAIGNLFGLVVRGSFVSAFAVSAFFVSGCGDGSVGSHDSSGPSNPSASIKSESGSSKSQREPELPLLRFAQGQTSYLVAFYVKASQTQILSISRGISRLKNLQMDIQGNWATADLSRLRNATALAEIPSDLGRYARNAGPRFKLMPEVFDLHTDGYARSLGTNRSERDLVVMAMDFLSAEEARTTIEKWFAQGEIAYAEPNDVSEISSAEELEAEFEPYRVDGFMDQAWWLSSIKLPNALNLLSEMAAADPQWAANLLANPPVVAILDSGIDFQHPALATKLIGPETVNTAGCFNDTHGCNTTVLKKGYLGNGDVFPYGTSGPNQGCFSPGPSGGGGDAKDPGICGHGTHVAGLIAGIPSPQEAAGGVCPFCQILAVRVVSDELNGKIPDSAILAGLKYISLFKRGGKPLVRVINMSFGKYTRSRSVSLMIRLLREEGTIMIAAAGNEDSMKRSYPAGYGDSLAVSALDRNLRRAPYSNFGPWVDLAAPGGAQQDVISSYPGGLWFGQNGTSQAAPIVSGVAALYVAVNPEASYDDIKTALLSSSNGAIYNIEVADGYNRYYLQKVEGESVLRPLLGAGIVDAEAALKGYVQGYTAAKNTQRVGYGCGVVGRRLSSSVPNGMAEFPMWLCVLLLPVLFLAVGGRGQGDASTARNSRRVASKGCGSI